jgi:acyl carrier protein
MSDDVATQVREILATILDASPDDNDALARTTNPKWDSLKHVEILFTLEEELQIRYDPEELAGLDSVNSIVDATLRHRTA